MSSDVHSKEIKEIRCRVTGRVQLVMFRDFVQRKGTKLGLAGTVKNLSDGSVAVVAQGSEEMLQKLIVYLWKGSVLSRVDNVAVTWHDRAVLLSKFSIVYG